MAPVPKGDSVGASSSGAGAGSNNVAAGSSSSRSGLRLVSSGHCSPLEGCHRLRDQTHCAAAAVQVLSGSPFEFRGLVRVPPGQPEGCIVRAAGAGAAGQLPQITLAKAKGHGPLGHGGGDCGFEGASCICSCSDEKGALAGFLHLDPALPGMSFLKMWLFPSPFLFVLLIGAWYLHRRQHRQLAAATTAGTTARGGQLTQEGNGSYLQLTTPR